MTDLMEKARAALAHTNASIISSHTADIAKDLASAVLFAGEELRGLAEKYDRGASVLAAAVLRHFGPREKRRVEVDPTVRWVADAACKMAADYHRKAYPMRGQTTTTDTESAAISRAFAEFAHILDPHVQGEER